MTLKDLGVGKSGRVLAVGGEKALRCRLLDMGIVEHLGRGRYLLAQRLYEAVGESNTHARLVGMGRAANKEILLRHIERNGDTGTPPRELQLILPNLSRRQVQLLLNELRDECLVYSEGQTTAVRWFSTPNQE